MFLYDTLIKFAIILCLFKNTQQRNVLK